MWRNRELDFASLDALIASLHRRPSHRGLRLAARAADRDALCSLGRDPLIRDLAGAEPGVRLLWDVCQIPDYRQLVLEDHVALLGDVFRQLSGPSGRLSTDWMADRIGRLDRAGGDVDDLLARLAFIRTWTYVAHRPAWVVDPGHWQERTRFIEDRLSDALHERLVDRFVDPQRHALRAIRPRDDDDEQPRGASPFAVLADLAIDPALPPRRPVHWIEQLIDAPHERIDIDADARIRFAGQLVGRLVRGTDLLRPNVVLADDVTTSRALRHRVERRLVAAGRDLAAEVLAPLRSDRLGDPGAAARGVIYQLEQGLGTIFAREAHAQLRALTPAERRRLEQAGICLGTHVVYLPAGLKPALVARRAALAAAFWGAEAEAVRVPASAVSIAAHPDRPAGLYAAIGFPLAGVRAVRAGRPGAARPGSSGASPGTARSTRAPPSAGACPVLATMSGRWWRRSAIGTPATDGSFVRIPASAAPRRPNRPRRAPARGFVPGTAAERENHDRIGT